MSLSIPACSPTVIALVAHYCCYSHLYHALYTACTVCVRRCEHCCMTEARRLPGSRGKRYVLSHFLIENTDITLKQVNTAMYPRWTLVYNKALYQRPYQTACQSVPLQHTTKKWRISDLLRYTLANSGGEILQLHNLMQLLYHSHALAIINNYTQID